MKVQRVRIKADNLACTGCLLCEITCSLHHTGIIQREASAIQVKTGDLHDSVHEPVVCRQCKKMLCLKGEGKYFDESEAGAFYWDNQARIDGCPFKAVFLFEGRVVHCDLCGGDPECVKSCPTGCLSIERQKA